MPAAMASQIEIDARYAAYVRRQDEDVAALKRDEAIAIPPGFDFASIRSLSIEIKQKLVAQQPRTLAQAGRIDGMTPAGLTLLLVAVKKHAKTACAERSRA